MRAFWSKRAWIEAALKMGSNKAYGAAAMCLVLTACGSDFALDGHEFRAHIAAEYPLGSDYSRIKDELSSHEFRVEVNNNQYGQFKFSTAQGIGHCGQVIQGSTDPSGSFIGRPSGKITLLRADQGCFRTF